MKSGLFFEYEKVQCFQEDGDVFWRKKNGDSLVNSFE